MIRRNDCDKSKNPVGTLLSIGPKPYSGLDSGVAGSSDSRYYLTGGQNSWGPAGKNDLAFEFNYACMGPSPVRITYVNLASGTICGPDRWELSL
jgi:hypothetical protein